MVAGLQPAKIYDKGIREFAAQRLAELFCLDPVREVSQD